MGILGTPKIEHVGFFIKKKWGSPRTGGGSDHFVAGLGARGGLLGPLGLFNGSSWGAEELMGSSGLGTNTHHDLGFYGKKGFERESTRIGDFIPAGPVPLFPQGCPFIPAGLSFYSRRAGAAASGGI